MSLLDVELDALRERQLVRVVDGARAAAHVLLPRVGTRLAAAARVLLAAKRASDLWRGRRRRSEAVASELSSPPRAPSPAPLVPQLTLTMPQSEPDGPIQRKTCAMLVVKMDDERPCGTSLFIATASSKVENLRTYCKRRRGGRGGGGGGGGGHTGDRKGSHEDGHEELRLDDGRGVVDLDDGREDEVAGPADGRAAAEDLAALAPSADGGGRRKKEAVASDEGGDLSPASTTTTTTTRGGARHAPASGSQRVRR